MARMPGTIWDPIPENYSQPPLVNPTQLIVHSAVGRGDLHDYFEQEKIVVESHFWVSLDGEIRQYIDTRVRADANFKANPRAISVETADNKDPDNFPWTSAQLDSMTRIIVWAHDVHGIPARRCRSWDDPGVGYHSQFPGVWSNVSGKTCPGRVRIAQFPGLLARVEAALAPPPPPEVNPLEELMAIDEAEFARLLGKALHTATIGRSGMTFALSAQTTRQGVAQALQRLAVLEADVADIKARLAAPPPVDPPPTVPGP